jgi:pimeloyl-ACP methyl ester carboxylesterase
MLSRSESRIINIGDDALDGTLLTPGSTLPGVLFVHGWGGSQQRDLGRARGIAGLGCVCLTFDLRGHGVRDRDAPDNEGIDALAPLGQRAMWRQQTVTRAHNLTDVVAAYDHLARHPAIGEAGIAVIGSSYGGYLASFLTELRPVRWLALRVPALYWDHDWDRPKQELDREELQLYRRRPQTPASNRALAACARFRGDVLIVESEHDEFVPHTTIVSYRDAFAQAHSLTHRIIDGADHALSTDAFQAAYTTLLTAWVSEMVIGARVADYPH